MKANDNFKRISLRKTVAERVDRNRGILSYSDFIFLAIEEWETNHPKKNGP